MPDQFGQSIILEEFRFGISKLAKILTPECSLKSIITGNVNDLKQKTYNHVPYLEPESE